MNKINQTDERFILNKTPPRNTSDPSRCRNWSNVNQCLRDGFNWHISDFIRNTTVLQGLHTSPSSSHGINEEQEDGLKRLHPVLASRCVDLQLLHVLTCAGPRLAAGLHLKNAGGLAGPGAAGQRKEMVSRCALLSSAVPLAAPLYWGPPHRLGTNGPRTALCLIPPATLHRTQHSFLFEGSGRGPLQGSVKGPRGSAAGWRPSYVHGYELVTCWMSFNHRFHFTQLFKSQIWNS